MADRASGSENRIDAWTARLAGLARARPAVALFATAWLVFTLAYFSVFLITGAGSGTGRLLVSALMNTSSAFVLAALLILLFERYVFDLKLARQALVHLVLAPVYALTWYVVVIVSIGWRDGSLDVGFEVFPFSLVAFTWQTFQGLTMYSAVAAAAWALRLYRAQRSAAADVAAAAPESPRRVLVRVDDALASLPVRDISRISARGDYADIFAAGRRHTARRTLASLAELLPGDQFVRVHRSHIVNLDAVISVEPAGDGRLTVHLPGGESVTTSRAGARLVRARAL
jgi:hypothetical protein